MVEEILFLHWLNVNTKDTNLLHQFRYEEYNFLEKYKLVFSKSLKSLENFILLENKICETDCWKKKWLRTSSSRKR